MAITVDDVRIHLGLDPATTFDGAALQAAVDAVNSIAPVLMPYLDGLAVWPPHIDEGGVLQAARWYGRRGSVQGYAAFADLGLGVLSQLDPDVRFLWQLGPFQPSVVA